MKGFWKTYYYGFLKEFYKSYYRGLGFKVSGAIPGFLLNNLFLQGYYKDTTRVAYCRSTLWILYWALV